MFFDPYTKWYLRKNEYPGSKQIRDTRLRMERGNLYGRILGKLPGTAAHIFNSVGCFPSQKLLGFACICPECRQITVTAGSAETIYDGAPLTCREYELSGELAEGHTVVVTLRGSQTGIGRCENMVESVVIYDRDGNDVTDGYIVVTVNGTLRVDPPVG